MAVSSPARCEKSGDGGWRKIPRQIRFLNLAPNPQPTPITRQIEVDENKDPIQNIMIPHTRRSNGKRQELAGDNAG
jgi:hypothetical protein